MNYRDRGSWAWFMMLAYGSCIGIGIWATFTLVQVFVWAVSRLVGHYT